MLAYLKDRKERKAAARDLYARLNDQSRQPAFYSVLGVPDTLDGRFELLLLHAALVWRRLGREGREGARLAQDVFDAMFRDIHHALRLIGIGDLSVPRHIKRMMKAYKGRAAAYDEALRAAAGALLESALRRNLYATLPDPAAAPADVMASYVRACAEHLERQSSDRVMAGQIAFPAPPAFLESSYDARMVV